MVQEQLRQEGQVLAVNRILVPIDLKHRHIVFLVPVDLVPRGVVQQAGRTVPLQLHFQRVEAQAEVADVEAIQTVVVYWIGAEIPGIRNVFSEL